MATIPDHGAGAGTPAETPAGRVPPDRTLMALVARAHDGDKSAVDRVFELVYGDLRAAAQRLLSSDARRHSIGATEIVNEAYLRMRGSDFPEVSDRRHLVNTAAIVLRRVLLDHARSKSRAKRGGGRPLQLDIDPATVPVIEHFGLENFERVHRALRELESEAPLNAEVVSLRLIVGLTITETADVVGISETTAKLRFRLGLVWLKQRLEQPSE